MILKDYFEHRDSRNWIIEYNNQDYILSYCYEDYKYYIDCLNCEYGYHDIQQFIKFIEPETYTVNHCMETTHCFLEKLIEDYNLLNGHFYILDGFFNPVVVIDNQSCDCAIEEFNSITLAMLWLYKGYYTSGHNDLYYDEF